MKRILTISLILILSMLINFTLIIEPSSAASVTTPVQSPLPDPVRQLPGLDTLTFYIQNSLLGGPTPFTFAVNSIALTGRRADPLSSASSDFVGLEGVEFDDVFYSDADGTFNANGRYVTIESVYTRSDNAGLRLAEVELNFAGGRVDHFNQVASFVRLGGTPGTERNAVDGNLSTNAQLGNTVGQTQRLRLTLGFFSETSGECSYSISPTSQTFSSSGGQGVITVTAPEGCAWSASFHSNPSFIRPTSLVEGSGNGSLSFSLMGNILSSDSRTGTIQIHRDNLSGPVVKTFTVTQGPFNCPDSVYSISPTYINIDHDDTMVSFNVTAPDDCVWEPTSKAPWISASPNSPQGRGSGSVSLQIQGNNGSWRSGGVVVADKVFTVYQNSPSCPVEYICVFFPTACIGSGAATLASARGFRDNVLAKTPRGRRYTQLYYQFSSEAVQVMLLNPMLILRSREMMERYKPALESMVKGETVTLTEGDLDEIDAFLDGLAAKGSAQFQEAVKDVCAEMRDPQMHAELGITLTRGPRRESPSGSRIQAVKQMGGLLLLLGAGGLLSYGLTGRRRRRLVRYGRLLLALTLGLSAMVNASALPASSGAQLAPASSALSYSTYLGGGGVDGGNSIAVDSAGNSYVVGFTDSINFPLANAAQASFGGGQQDLFVAKFNPAGGLVYSTYLGGDGQDSGTSIAVDKQGNAYITGFTTSANFPTRNALQPERRGPFDAFVAKLDPAGALAYSTYLGGSGGEHGSSIAVDSSGDIFVAGITQSHDFPLANAFQGLYGGTADAYLARINAAGTRLVYSTYLGGAGADAASSIAVDAAGNLYVAGVTMSPNFPTADPLQTRLGGFFDSFVAKLNPAGTRLIYSTYLGGSGEDRALRISVDNGGNAYVTGDTDSPNFPTVNAAQSASGGSSDAFVTKINATGSALLYSTYLGGSGIDGGAAIAVDDAGHAYVTGFTASADFPMALSLQPMFGGGYDGFVARLNPTGGAFDQSSYLGGSGIDSAFGVAAAPSGVVFVMGVTDSTNLPTANPFQPGNGGGGSDIFLAKIKQGPAITRAANRGKHLIITGSGFEPGAVILLDGDEQKTIYKSGSSLKGKKAGQKIAPGETVRLHVRNPDGTTSAEFLFTR